MIPNKLVRYEESIIPVAIILIKELKKTPIISIFDLYKRTLKGVKDVNQYLESLSFLYAIGYIEYNNGGIKLC